MRTKSALVAVATAAIAIAGCGGSSSTTGGATGATGATGAQGAPLSKSAFLAKGNAICAKGNQQIQAATKKEFPQGQQPSQAELNKFATDTLIPVVQQEIDGIKALPPPSGDEDKVNAIISAAQSALDKGKQDPSTLVSQGSDPFAQANKLANAYGLTKCGSNNG